MKLGFLTNLRAPYRTIQLDKFSEINELELTVYYTDKPNENRKWKVVNSKKFKEVDLKGYKIFKKYGYINKGLIELVKTNDLIILGCYEQPTYILVSIICRILGKPYILSFDGINTNRVYEKEKLLKKIIKGLVVKKAKYILGNGTVSKMYFKKHFKYPENKIYNQFLTVDSETINKLYENRYIYRKTYRAKLCINDTSKVIIYSGRLIKIKNICSVIEAINKSDVKDIVFLILGDGELREDIKKLSEEKGVKIIFSGFIDEQKELFKYYFAGDVLVLPSIYEPWGLVVNEAMMSGLPVICSELCGCSMDLVKNGINGYLFNPYRVEEIAFAIESVFKNNDLKKMGYKSRTIIKEWTFENSKKKLCEIVDALKKEDV